MRIDHVGIAVRCIDEALQVYRDAAGCEPDHRAVVPHEGVEVAMIPAGESRVELLQPTGPESPVARFLERRGEGMHHLALQVADLDGAMDALKAAGRTLVGDGLQVGAEGYRYVFVHPKHAGGVLLELVERS